MVVVLYMVVVSAGLLWGCLTLLSPSICYAICYVKTKSGTIV